MCLTWYIKRILLLRSITNGVYTLMNNDSLEEYQVYCHMTEIPECGSGGWTLVMKIDGYKVKIILYLPNNLILANLIPPITCP